jgi:membrane glycosyltransferase
MDHAVFWWFLPVLVGMLLSIPFTVLTSRGAGGRAARNAGLFLTPEEVNPNPEVIQLRSSLEKLAEIKRIPSDKEQELERAILNPYRHALHIWLLRERQKDPASTGAANKLSEGLPPLESLRNKLLQKGIQALTTKEKLRVFSDVESMEWLHRKIWRASDNDKLSESWQKALGAAAT